MARRPTLYEVQSQRNWLTRIIGTLRIIQIEITIGVSEKSEMQRKRIAF